MLYRLARPFLFALDPEFAHDLTIAGLRILHSARPCCTPCGAAGGDRGARDGASTFPTASASAAGLDKNGEAIDALAALGFGFVEIGTVTPRPQPGNPKPRLFRLPERQAIINRMGFNNHGVEALIANVKKSRFAASASGGGMLGINIGKNFDTPIERAADDYLLCLQRVYPHRQLRRRQHLLAQHQEPAPVAGRIGRTRRPARRPQGGAGAARRAPRPLRAAGPEDRARPRRRRRSRPSPTRCAATASTASSPPTPRSRVRRGRPPHADEAGGLSGAPLFEKSTAVVGQLARALQGEIPIIGVGGILSGDAGPRQAGSRRTLVQLYTGLIYRGPGSGARVRRRHGPVPTRQRHGAGMIVGTPREIKNHEYRVGLTPAGVHALVCRRPRSADRAQCRRCGSDFPMPPTPRRERRSPTTRRRSTARADMVVKVKELQASEYALARPGQILFCYHHLAPDPAIGAAA